MKKEIKILLAVAAILVISLFFFKGGYGGEVVQFTPLCAPELNPPQYCYAPGTTWNGASGLLLGAPQGGITSFSAKASQCTAGEWSPAPCPGGWVPARVDALPDGQSGITLYIPSPATPTPVPTLAPTAQEQYSASTATTQLAETNIIAAFLAGLTQWLRSIFGGN